MFGDVTFAQAPFAALGGATLSSSVAEAAVAADSVFQDTIAGGNITEAAAAADFKVKQQAEAMAAALKKTTIACSKGKLVKKVTGVKPVCPKGYKKK